MRFSPDVPVEYLQLTKVVKSSQSCCVTHVSRRFRARYISRKEVLQDISYNRLPIYLGRWSTLKDETGSWVCAVRSFEFIPAFLFQNWYKILHIIVHAVYICVWYRNHQRQNLAMPSAGLWAVHHQGRNPPIQFTQRNQRGPSTSPTLCKFKFEN